MNVRVGTEVIGLDRVIAKVDNLDKIVSSAPVRKGLRAGARLIANAGRSKLKTLYKGYQTGQLERSIRSRVKRRKSGALAGFYRGQGGGNHAHLVDRGTKARYTRKGHYRGVMPANYFWTISQLTYSRQAGEMVIRGLKEAMLKLV